MPAGHGNDEEIFAAAVEHGTHPGFRGDVELARDLDLVAMLRSSGPELAPRPDERARARAAVFARLAAADDPSDHVPLPGPEPVGDPDVRRAGSATAMLQADPFPAEPLPAVPLLTGALPTGALPTETLPAEPATGADGDDGPVDELAELRRSRRGGRHKMPADGTGEGSTRRPPVGGRIVMVAAAAVLGTAVLGGAGVLASRDSLPGDGLYPVKRVAESAGLAMTWDDAARGRRNLDLASTRIDEVEQLLAEDPESGMDPEVFSSALHDFDSHADEGSRLLLADEDVPREQAEADLQNWASGQAERLAALRGDLPGPAASDADGSLDRLEQLAGPDPTDLPTSCSAGPDGTADQADAQACAAGSDDPGVTGTTEPGAPGGTTATDPAQTRRPGTSTSSGPSGPSDPSGPSGPSTGSQGGTPQPGGGGQGGPLPDLLPDNPLGGVLGGPTEQGPTGGSSSGDDQGGDDQGGGGEGSGGGLPPVEVPPLLPGLLGG